MKITLEIPVDSIKSILKEFDCIDNAINAWREGCELAGNYTEDEEVEEEGETGGVRSKMFFDASVLARISESFLVELFKEIQNVRNT